MWKKLLGMKLLVTFSAILDNNVATRWRSCGKPTSCTADLCNSVPGVRSPPGGSTTRMLRYTSVTAVESNTFLALLPKIYDKISVTVDWLRKIGNNHVLRANASRVHTVVIVDICASVIGYWSTSRLQKYIFVTTSLAKM